MDGAEAHLLLVEDYAPMRRVVRRLLERYGFRVDEPPDGEAALAAFRLKPYDVIVTDWNMPCVDGAELLRAVRAATERADTPVLVMTSDDSAQVPALEAGADGFVPKPSLAHALGEAVRRLVAARRAAAPPRP